MPDPDPDPAAEDPRTAVLLRCAGLEAELRASTAQLLRVQEELAWKTAFLDAQANATIDGIIVVDRQGRKILQNQRAADLFQIPPHIVEDPDDTVQVRWVMNRVRDPAPFIEQVVHLYAHPHEISRDEIELKDGTVLDRYSSPVLGKDQKCYGRLWTFRDITELKRAEASLREREDQLRAALVASGTGTFRWDFRTNEVHRDAALDALFGMPLGDTVHSLQTSIAPIHPDDLAAVRERCQRCVQDGADFDMEYRVIWPDGSVHWLDSKGRTSLDDAGKPVLMTGSCVDITVRKVAAETLRESEEKFRLMAGNISDVIWITSPDFQTIYYISPAYEVISGHALASLYAHPRQWVEAILPEERERVFATLALLMEDAPEASAEYRISRPDGSIRWIHNRGFQVRDAAGKLIRLTGIATDITARKQADEALQRQQAELRVLFDLVPAMIWFKDTHNGILRANQRVATAAGRPLDQIEGRSALEVYPGEAEGFYADDLEVICSGVPKLGYVEAMHGPQGEEVWMETDKVPYCDENGRVVGIVVMAQDITARKHADQVLRDSEERFRFLNDLTEATRTLGDPAQIMGATSRFLGAHLRASRCAYADVAADGEHFTIPYDYTDSCASTVGQYQLSLFGPQTVAMLHRGQTLVIHNVLAELTPCEGADMFSALGIQAIITCPLVKDGTLRAMVAVHQTTPRDWRPGEVAHVEDVVERCWAAIERRAAEENLRVSKHFAESIAEHSPNIIYLFDLETRKTVYTNRNAAESLGYSQAEIHAMGDDLLPTIIHPEDLPRVLRQIALFADVPDDRIIDFEYRLRHVNGETRWIWTHETVFNRRPNGAAWQIMGTAQDITGRKEAEAELARTHHELLETSRLAGMAEVATGVLHNVGNVLNSVNVAASCLADSLRQSKAANLSKVVTLLDQHAGDLGTFLTSDPKGSKLPAYLAQLAEHLAGEQTNALHELSELQRNIEHIKDIVNMQQGFAKVSGVAEMLQPADLVEDALRMNASSLTRHDITVTQEFAPVPPVLVEKHKALQILVNLLRNAKQACDECSRPDKHLTLRVTSDATHVRIAVTDNGVGIPPENLTRIFAHGFTTKKSGHGFGLHSGALAARELGGALTVHSGGPGQGATFTLELPCPAPSTPPP